MSSHHIIREKQEPALLILGLNNFTDELLGQLLEWSPTLMVTADTAEVIHSMGIKFDVVLDTAISASGIQSDVKYIAPGHSAVTAALNYLAANNYSAVNIIADEFNLDDYLPYTGQINIVIFNNGQKIYPVTSGFNKWKPAGELIRILSPVTTLHTTGLETISRELYQTLDDGLFSLQFAGQVIFISESIT